MTDPPNSTGAPYEGRMLMLPWARVLFAADTGDIYNYVPDNRTPREEWRPVITCVPGFMLAGGSYTLQDRQVTGLSHLSVYCDDATMASHYPIVRLRHANGNVYDSRTFSTAPSVSRRAPPCTRPIFISRRRFRLAAYGSK